MVVYRELSSLTHDLGYSAKALYSVSNQIGKHYHAVSIPKASGGTRSLHVPDDQLKAIQKKIYDIILAPEPISPYATAYRPGCSTKINAKLHVGRSVLVKLDILHFFDSIIYPIVKERVFPAERYSDPNRILLTILCTYHEAVPQGAPTSPAISNIIMREFDDTIGRWCDNRGIAYTRYCDDMTFSGDFDPAPLIELVRSELRKMGFLLNDKKTVIIRGGRQKVVTGIVVNEKENVPAEYRRKIRKEVFYCKRFGIEAHMCHENIPGTKGQYILKLLGKVNYVLSVSPNEPEYGGYRDWLLREKKHA